MADHQELMRWLNKKNDGERTPSFAFLSKQIQLLFDTQYLWFVIVYSEKHTFFNGFKNYVMFL